MITQQFFEPYVEWFMSEIVHDEIAVIALMSYCGILQKRRMAKMIGVCGLPAVTVEAYKQEVG
jgi:hypothetical protein